jgi:two-component system LytT family sensor kinase
MAMEKPLIQNFWLRWLATFLGFSFLANYFALSWIIGEITEGRAIDWHQLNLGTYFFWGTWLLLMPLILQFTRRYNFTADNWKQSIIAHTFFYLIIVPGQYFLWHGLYGLFFEDKSFLAGNFFHTSIVCSYKYFIILFIYYFLILFRRSVEKEKEAAIAEAKSSILRSKLTQAQLDAIKARLHPHFLFNTLNTISILIDEDPGRAVKMLNNLSQFLRHAIDKKRDAFTNSR